SHRPRSGGARSGGSLVSRTALLFIIGGASCRKLKKTNPRQRNPLCGHGKAAKRLVPPSGSSKHYAGINDHSHFRRFFSRRGSFVHFIEHPHEHGADSQFLKSSELPPVELTLAPRNHGLAGRCSAQVVPGKTWKRSGHIADA